MASPSHTSSEFKNLSRKKKVDQVRVVPITTRVVSIKATACTTSNVEPLHLVWCELNRSVGVTKKKNVGLPAR